jgi:hypothetical protein
MIKKRGRPKKEIPPELVQEIIYRYTTDHNISGKISYMDVYRFSQEQFEKGEISCSIGEFYWRKGEGRLAIDKANQVIMHTVTNSFNEDEVFVDTEDAINKFFKGSKADRVKLTGALKMNETKLQKYIQRTKKLEKELFEVRQELVKEKEQCKSWQATASNYQEKMFQWMELSMSKDVPLINLLTTGQTRTEPVKVLLESILSSNPLEVFDKMNDIKQQFNQETLNVNSKADAISLDSYKNKKKSVLDDFDF